MFTCTDCSQGKYAQNSGRTACDDCLPGKYSCTLGAANASFCLECDAGKFSPARAAISVSSCLGCAAGKYSYSGNSHCTVCPQDSTSREESEGPEWCQCAAGYWGAVGSDCSACTAGKFLPGIGHRLDNCVSCHPGTFSAAGATLCTECQAGKFGETAEMSSCSLCPLDKYSGVQGSTFCTNCTLEICETGQYRSRCLRGSIRDGACVGCTYKKSNIMFTSHGEYNDTCAYVCKPPYKEDCQTKECKRCDPGTYALGVTTNGQVYNACA